MSTSKNLTIFGISSDPDPVFNIFHDESGTYKPGTGDRWLLHGILFVPERIQSALVRVLFDVRKKQDYFEEVHYVKLRSSILGPKAQCARGWLNLYVCKFAEKCFYHCLAIDTHSPAFQHNKFGVPYYAYNYFARVAIVGGIAWSLKKFSKVTLKFHTDGKSRQMGDNFVTYIPKAVINAVNSKRIKKPSRYPEIRLAHQEVIPIESDPKLVCVDKKEECELIQLVDLLTSNISQAMIMSSCQKAKIVLSELIAQLIEDVKKPPWLQTKKLHRCFSVSCFPDEKGKYYNPTLAVTNRNQISLF
ncbi:MAG: hypothetical protein ACFFDN_21910 [Candidatus Hodarchaeota archaeon]